MKTKKLMFSMFVVGVFILSFTVIPITMNAYAATNTAKAWKCYISPARQWDTYEAIIVEIWTKDETGKYIQGVSMYVNVLDFLDRLERRILIKEDASGVPRLYPNANFLGIIDEPVDRREIYIRPTYPTMSNGIIATTKEVAIRLEIRTASGERGIERKYYNFYLPADDWKAISIEGATINVIDRIKEVVTNTNTNTNTDTDTDPEVSDTEESQTDTGSEPETYMEFGDYFTSTAIDPESLNR